MKFIINILFSFIIIQISYSQTVVLNGIPAIGTKKTWQVKEGQVVTMNSLVISELDVTVYANDGSGQVIDISGREASELIVQTYRNERDFWLIQAIRGEVYDNILKNGMQYDVRKDLEEDALEFIGRWETAGMLFHDPYLENYLYALVYELYPHSLDDIRSGNINIKILKDNMPQAMMLPNGSLVLTTGLLSTTTSEDELMGVLAHEVAHFVLDHTIINRNKTVQRQKRAEFWAGMATVFAAATETYLAAKDGVYTYGALTLGTAAISYSIASAVKDRLGLNFNQEQEEAADECAKQLLDHKGRDSKAFGSFFVKLKERLIKNYEFQAISGEGTHPDLDSRIAKFGEINLEDYYETGFIRKVSLINTFNARLEYVNGHFETALMLTERNFEANIEVEEDYLLKSIITNFMYDNPQSNEKALHLITESEKLNVYPIVGLQRQKGLAQIRLGKHAEAVESFEKYYSNLDSLEEGGVDVTEQKRWAKIMIYKTRSLD